jgi:Family of unknown function (DUF6314)
VTTIGPGRELTGGTLEFLRGRWQADRVLADHRSGTAGTFRGLAAFVPQPDGGLAFHEDGELRFGGHHGPASRSLRYRPGTDGGAADVLFADGRPFYRLDMRAGWWRAEHQCRDDQYLVTVRVLGPDSFAEHWRASGPGKDYEMTTTFTRLAGRP